MKWIFYAYKNDDDYKKSKHYFKKTFNDHTEMKIFTAEFAVLEKIKYPDYCTTYKKI